MQGNEVAGAIQLAHLGQGEIGEGSHGDSLAEKSVEDAGRDDEVGGEVGSEHTEHDLEGVEVAL